MPAALVRVEKSSKLLEEASGMLNQDPYSGPARKRLIEGSGGILQVRNQINLRESILILILFFLCFVGDLGSLAMLRRIRS